MPDQELLDRLKQGKEAWNEWRAANPKAYLNLQGADLSSVNLSGYNLGRADLTLAKLFGADLSMADLSGAILFKAHLSTANLFFANLAGADLYQAILRGVHLSSANLSGACLDEAEIVQSTLSHTNLNGAQLCGADLIESNFNGASLRDAKLGGANLSGATLVGSDLAGADLAGCRVHGVSSWNTRLEGADQTDLIITATTEPDVTVDNLEVAQFIYLLLNNRKVRDVIDTITSKAVLILGRFTEERKAVLDALREELRRRNYLPILFDFEKPSSRDLTETVSTLAHMSRFVIADITDAKSIPQELKHIVPQLPSLPVQPLILSSQYEYAMFEHFYNFPWVLAPYRYDGPETLLSSLEERVIAPVEAKAKEIEERRKAFEDKPGG